MNNEVPGITVPPAIMERMRPADTGDRARAEGVKIAQETLLAIRGLVQGVQIAAPFGPVCDGGRSCRCPFEIGRADGVAKN